MVRNSQKRFKLILGMGVILIFMVIAFSAMEGFVSPYKTVTEVTGSPEKYSERQVQVEGTIIKETINWAPPVLKFAITDGKNQVDVKYEGVLPGSFPTGRLDPNSEIDVVVIGSMSGEGEFAAGDILVKCPSKYEQKLNESSFN